MEITWVLELINQYPTIGSILAFLALVGFAFKPLMTAVDTYVLNTPSTKDDEYVEGIKSAKWYKVIAFILDWAIRVKIPK